LRLQGIFCSLLAVESFFLGKLNITDVKLFGFQDAFSYS